MKKILTYTTASLLIVALGYFLVLLFPALLGTWLNEWLEDPDPLASRDGYMAREAQAPCPTEDDAWIDEVERKLNG